MIWTAVLVGRDSARHDQDRPGRQLLPWVTLAAVGMKNGGLPGVPD